MFRPVIKVSFQKDKTEQNPLQKRFKPTCEFQPSSPVVPMCRRYLSIKLVGSDMRQREIERKQKAKFALKQLNKLREQGTSSAITKVIDGKLVTSIEFNKSISKEMSRLAAVVARHPDLIKPVRKRKPKPLPNSTSEQINRESLYTDEMLARRWHCSVCVRGTHIVPE